MPTFDLNEGREATEVSLELPWPPSVNELYESARRNGKFTKWLNPKVEAYRLDCAALYDYVKFPLVGDVYIGIIANPPTRKDGTGSTRTHDLDNILKVPLDFLQWRHYVTDDCQFAEINIVRGVQMPKGLLQIILQEVK